MVPRKSFMQRFTRGELVGKGGAGCVYRAVDRGSGRVVALKVLTPEDPASRGRFDQEARALASISHPHVVRYVDHGVTDAGELFLAMEWLDGENLARRLTRGPLPVEECVALGRRVAEALAVAHAQGVVHRDIKPSNLFLVEGRAGSVQVLDFGVASLAGESLVLSHSGGMIGTPGYMAPEQARSERGVVEPRADVFSLGVVLFECLTGRRAFEGIHVLAVLAQLLLAEVPRVRELVPRAPPALDDLIARMLAKDPAARPADGAEVARELAALEAEGMESTPLSEAARSITGVERKLIAVVAILRDPAGDAATTRERVRDIGAEHDAGVFDLAGGTALLTLPEQGGATEQAAAAARCALRLRGALPGASVALVMGRAEATGRLPIGPVVERAAELLHAGAGAPVVHIDEVTHALLDARFEVRSEDGSLSLSREHAIGEGARTLLGKPSPYLGRERELRFVRELVQAAFDGERPAQAVIVTAPAGMGKTRLRHELVKGLREARPDVLIGLGRADPMSAGSAFVVVGSAVRHALGLAPEQSQPHARLAERVAAFVPAEERRRVAVFLGELIGVTSPGEPAPELLAARRNSARMAEEIERAVIDLLRGACAAQPVMLVLEDVHWGDPASLALVDRALRELEGQPLVVLALGRPEMHESFPQLWSKRDAQHVRLGALGRRAAEEMITRALGSTLPPEVRSRVIDQAAGNAFYLEELIRALAEGRREGLPETVLGMVEARIEALPPEARRLLRAASVFGEAFSKNGALALLGAHERRDAGQHWLPWLVERELVVRRSEPDSMGEAEYAFRHALVREASYAMLTAGDLTLGHRLAGEWMLGVGPANAEARAAVIGEHFCRAEAWDEAATVCAQAGDAAARLHASTEARVHYRRALAALRKLEDTVPRLRRRVDVVLRQVAVSYGDDPGPNLALLAEAEAIAGALPQAGQAPSEDYRRVARVLYWTGRCHWYRNAYSDAIRYYERTIAAARELGDDELEAHPSGTIGRVLMAQGQFGRAVPYLERSLGPLARSEQWVDWVVNAANRAITMSAAGRGAEAIAEGERVLARAREIHSLTSESVACINLGNIHVLSGSPARAVELLEVAAERAERGEDRAYSFLAHGFASWAEARLDHPEAATRHITRSHAIMAAMGRRLFYADWFDAFAIEAAQRAGRSGEAISEASRVVGDLVAAGNVFAEGLVRRAWGLALAADSGGARAREALALLGESRRLFSLGEAHVEVARTRIGLARLHRLLGDPASAAREVEEARRILAPIGAAGEIEAELGRGL